MFLHMELHQTYPCRSFSGERRFISAGLNADYNPIVLKFIDQLNMTWIELQSALLAFENRLEQLNHFSSLFIQPSTGLTQKEESDTSKNTNDKPSWHGSCGGRASTQISWA